MISKFFILISALALANFVQSLVPPPNIGFMQNGYNIYFGNPLPNGGVDPGFGMQIFDFEADKSDILIQSSYIQSKGVSIYDYPSCLYAQTASQIKTIEDYETYLSACASVSVDFDIGSFSASGEYQTIQKLFSSSESSTFMMESNCTVYGAELNGDMPRLSQAFIEEVSRIDPLDLTSYYNLFENFGTHYASSMIFGAKVSILSVFNSNQQGSSESTLLSEQTSLSVDFIVTFSASESLTHQDSESSYLSTSTSYTQETTLGCSLVDNSGVNWDKNIVPVPISYKLNSISELFQEIANNPKSPIPNIQALNAGVEDALNSYGTFVLSNNKMGESDSDDDSDSLASGIYYMKTGFSNYYLRAAENSDGPDYFDVVLDTHDDLNDIYYQWNFTVLSNGYYEITSVAYPDNALFGFLYVRDGFVQARPLPNYLSNHSEWDVSQIEGSRYSLFNVMASKYLNFENCWESSDHTISVIPCIGGDTVMLGGFSGSSIELMPVEKGSLPSGIYYMNASSWGYYLRTAPSNYSRGIRDLVLEAPDILNDAYYQWNFTLMPDGLYQITSVAYPDMALYGFTYAGNSFVQIRQTPSTPIPNTEWQVEQKEDNYYSITNVFSNRMIDFNLCRGNGWKRPTPLVGCQEGSPVMLWSENEDQSSDSDSDSDSVAQSVSSIQLIRVPTYKHRLHGKYYLNTSLGYYLRMSNYTYGSGTYDVSINKFDENSDIYYQWEVSKISNGYYQITSVADPSSALFGFLFNGHGFLQVRATDELTNHFWWKVVHVEDNSFGLFNDFAQQYIDVEKCRGDSWRRPVPIVGCKEGGSVMLGLPPFMGSDSSSVIQFIAVSNP